MYRLSSPLSLVYRAGVSNSNELRGTATTVISLGAGFFLSSFLFNGVFVNFFYFQNESCGLN